MLLDEWLCGGDGHAIVNAGQKHQGFGCQLTRRSPLDAGRLFAKLPVCVSLNGRLEFFRYGYEASAPVLRCEAHLSNHPLEWEKR